MQVYRVILFLSRSVSAQLQSRKSLFLGPRGPLVKPSMSVPSRPHQFFLLLQSLSSSSTSPPFPPSVTYLSFYFSSFFSYLHLCRTFLPYQQKGSPTRAWIWHLYFQPHGCQVLQEMKHKQKQSVSLTVKKCHQLASGFCT